MSNSLSETLRSFLQAATEANIIQDTDYLNLLINCVSESDRGAVLVLHSAIDDALQKLILRFLERHAPDAKGDQEWLVSFEHSPVPPLGGFGVKTRFCHAVGLINSELKDRLTKLGKIRNPFAHGWNQDVKLQRSHIDSLLASVDTDLGESILRVAKLYPEHTERITFTSIAGYVLSELLVRINEVTNNPLDHLQQPDSGHESTPPISPQSEGQPKQP